MSHDVTESGGHVQIVVCSLFYFFDIIITDEDSFDLAMSRAWTQEVGGYPPIMANIPSALRHQRGGWKVPHPMGSAQVSCRISYE